MPASQLITPLTFDTSRLPGEHQFEAWRAYQSSVIDVSPNLSARDGFGFRQDVWDLGPLAFTTAQMPGPLVPRTWRHLRKDPLDHWCLVLPESHAARIAGNQPKQLYIRSLARPYEGKAADSSVSTMFIPRDLLRPISGVLDSHGGTLPSAGLGGLLYDFLIALERRLPMVEAKDLPQLIEGIRALIVACIAPTSDRLREASEQIATTVLERVRQTIHRNLRAPNLGPTMLCTQLGISRSKLYRLFEPMGGVGRYILRQRLIAAHEALSDPSEKRSVAALAEELCFSDAASFSRAFRKEMGYSPSDVRTASRGAYPSFFRLPSMFQGVQLGDLGQVLCYLQV